MRSGWGFTHRGRGDSAEGRARQREFVAAMNARPEAIRRRIETAGRRKAARREDLLARVVVVDRRAVRWGR